jgi:hypothetical protein
MLRPTTILSLFFLLLTVVFLTRCSEDQVIEMESLERDLLLTWIALEREDAPRVTAYNTAVQQDWLLLQRHFDSKQVSPALRQSAMRVNVWMLKLRNAVDYQQAKRATVAINLIQNELRRLRPQYGMNHPADRLYDFYYQWQDVVAASNDPMIELLEWKEFEKCYELAVRSWAACVAAQPRFSNTLFPGYGQNAGGTEAAALTITRSLEYFTTILGGADHTLAAEPSQKINALFFDYLAVVTAYPSQAAVAGEIVQ